ncbi:MAG: penicillin-binding protein, partial [Solirubrobacteraceae bacterium]|nr:penicillin-binding protein [Solirubrobacteraceae bacterium]
IRRLFGVFVLMFAALLGATAWWTVVRADQLNRDYPRENARDLLRGIKIRRGDIRAADGTLIAHSTRDKQGVYTRRYPLGEVFAHPVGYSFVNVSQTELEAFYNHELSGGASTTDSILATLVGSRSGGDDLRTTLDPKAQKLALDLIAQASPTEGGAAVVLDPKTGAVKVMASVPGYDPNQAKSAHELNKFGKDNLRKPLVNRALQFGYAPGSTMKLVTLVAALDSGRYKATDLVNGDNDVKISGVPLTNDFGRSWGNIDLPRALAQSVNTVFAQIAEKLGGSTMRKYMERFGFDRKPRLDYPAGEMSAAGEFRNGRLIPPTSRFVDVGRMGIGQDKLQVPPIQMAEVAAAIANGGKLMRPHIGDRFLDSDGRTSKKIDDQVQSTVMSPETAAAVNAMMVGVVQNGTGTKAQIAGMTVAGKTGTAETTAGANQKNNLWFVGFAPADNPQVAFAVTVKDVVGFGGDVAAPIAKALIEQLVK